MAETITIDKAGRIVLPKPLRERFKLEGGAKLRVESVGDHLELTPVELSKATTLVEKNGLLVVAATGKSCDVAEALAEDREDREETLSGK